MSFRSRIALSGLLGSLLLCAPALAQLPTADLPEEDLPYVTQQEFVSPITGEKFYAFVLRQELPASNYDFDGCPHPPINTLAYTLVIDPVSGYADYPENINITPRERLSALLSAIGQPRFSRSAPEGLPWAGAYPWEKFENAAKLSEANKAGDLSVGNWWLQAAWSVRLDVVSGHNDFDTEVGEIFGKLPKPRAVPADLLCPPEILMAAQLEQLRAQNKLPALGKGETDLALAWLYRSRGELMGAKAYLSKAAEAAPELRHESQLWGFLDSSIRLEEDYLRTTLAYLSRAYSSGTAGPAKEGALAFLLGEIERRLGDTAAASKWYADAAIKSRGAVNPQLIERQTRLAAGRGY